MAESTIPSIIGAGFSLANALCHLHIGRRKNRPIAVLLPRSAGKTGLVARLQKASARSNLLFLDVDSMCASNAAVAASNAATTPCQSPAEALEVPAEQLSAREILAQEAGTRVPTSPVAVSRQLSTANFCTECADIEKLPAVASEIQRISANYPRRHLVLVSSDSELLAHLRVKTVHIFSPTADLVAEIAEELGPERHVALLASKITHAEEFAGRAIHAFSSFDALYEQVKGLLKIK